MYKLAIDFGGHYKGEQVYVGLCDIFCKPSNAGIHNIGIRDDLQTLIERGIIEKIQEPEFTKNDMIEFLNFGLAQDEQPISSDERFEQFINMIKR